MEGWLWRTHAMRTFRLAAGPLVCLLIGSTPAAGQRADLKAVDDSLKVLPAALFWNPLSKYKVDSYIRAAAALQSVGRERAIKQLRARGGMSTFVLCRMLFTAKTGGEFRRPGIGDSYLIYGADPKDWPLQPIEVVDGVPFLVTQGGGIAGFPESSGQYLAYCAKECDWNKFEYKAKTPEEKRAALKKLLASDKVKGKLREGTDKFLEAQIE
jgi:hypothetical protein